MEEEKKRARTKLFIFIQDEIVFSLCGDRRASAAFIQEAIAWCRIRLFKYCNMNLKL
jgi:hypothetical protein